MRTRKEIEEAIKTCKTVQVSTVADPGDRYDWYLWAERALQWVLGKDDCAFGPVREKGPGAKRGRKALGVPVGRLMADRQRGRSLKALAKDYHCSKSSVIVYLKQGRNSLTLEEREDYDRCVREQCSRKKGKG